MIIKEPLQVLLLQDSSTTSHELQYRAFLADGKRGIHEN